MKPHYRVLFESEAGRSAVAGRVKGMHASTLALPSHLTSNQNNLLQIQACHLKRAEAVNSRKEQGKLMLMWAAGWPWRQLAAQRAQDHLLSGWCSCDHWQSHSRSGAHRGRCSSCSRSSGRSRCGRRSARVP